MTHWTTDLSIGFPEISLRPLEIRSRITGADSKIGASLGFNGNSTAHADGFSCQSTGREDRTLPVAFYRFTNGSRQVTFNRS